MIAAKTVHPMNPTSTPVMDSFQTYWEKSTWSMCPVTVIITDGISITITLHKTHVMPTPIADDIAQYLVFDKLFISFVSNKLNHGSSPVHYSG